MGINYCGFIGISNLKYKVPVSEKFSSITQIDIFPFFKAFQNCSIIVDTLEITFMFWLWQNEIHCKEKVDIDIVVWFLLLIAVQFKCFGLVTRIDLCFFSSKQFLLIHNLLSVVVVYLKINFSMCLCAVLVIHMTK